jgi:hypothetical protein
MELGFTQEQAQRQWAVEFVKNDCQKPINHLDALTISSAASALLKYVLSGEVVPAWKHEKATPEIIQQAAENPEIKLYKLTLLEGKG